MDDDANATTVTSRVAKALAERLYLVEVHQAVTEWQFGVRGASAHTYTVHVTADGCRCSCPDHKIRKTVCKHVLYLVCRVGLLMDLGAQLADPDRAALWSPETFAQCTRAWTLRLAPLLRGHGSPVPVPAATATTDDMCAICFELLGVGAGAGTVITCPAACHKPFHGECIDVWLGTRRSHTCPLCRGDWNPPATTSSVPSTSASGVATHLAEVTGTLLPTATAAPATGDVEMADAEASEMSNVVVDIVFTFDTTGSMYPCFAEVKRRLRDVTRTLFERLPQLRIAVMAHGDYCDRPTTYLVRTLDFSRNVPALCDFVRDTPPTHGGDHPEAYEYVLRECRTTLSWRPEATVKAIVMIGDAPPHEPDSNPEHIDWRAEAVALREAGMSVIAVQCLNKGHRPTYAFYSTVALETHGYHLFLDQFAYVEDLMMAVCLRQANEMAALTQLEHTVRTRGGLTNAMRLMFDTMLGKLTRREVDNQVGPDAFVRHYRAPAAASAGAPAATAATAADLRPCAPTQFQVFTVDTTMSIKEFCEHMGIRFQQGRGFYEFTKSDVIQPDKEIVLMQTSTGDLYEGAVARVLAGIPVNTERARLKPGHVEGYRVFIQSKSYNRKLLAGQRFLYEVNPPDVGAS